MTILDDFHFANGYEMWLWKGDGSETFTFKGLRLLMGCSLDNNISPFKWVKWIPLGKIFCVTSNQKKKILVYVNAMNHGISISSSLCPFCRYEEKILDNVYFSR